MQPLTTVHKGLESAQSPAPKSYIQASHNHPVQQGLASEAVTEVLLIWIAAVYTLGQTAFLKC